jgi:hypothetical protein
MHLADSLISRANRRRAAPELARRVTGRFSCAAGLEHGALYEKAQRKWVSNLDEAATLVDSTEFDG